MWTQGTGEDLPLWGKILVLERVDKSARRAGHLASRKDEGHHALWLFMNQNVCNLTFLMKENEYLQCLSVSVIARLRVCFPRAHVWDGEWTWGRKLVCLLTVKICDSGKSNPPFWLHTLSYHRRSSLFTGVMRSRRRNLVRELKTSCIVILRWDEKLSSMKQGEGV